MITLVAQASEGLLESCGATPGVVCEWVYDATHNERVARFADWVVAKPAKFVLILVIAFVVNRLIRRGIRKMIDRLVEEREEHARQRHQQEVEDGRFAALRARALEKATLLALQTERSKQRAQALGTVLRSITSLTVYGMAAIIALGEFGISLGPLVAGAGIAGVAIGFGAQTLVRDFLSGIFMLIEDQFGVGDIVDVGEASGVVEEVNLRTTRLRDVNGTVWWIPNGEIRRIGNKSQQWARTVLDVDVAYDTDLGRAAEVIKRVADSVWHDQLEAATVLEEPEIWGVEAFKESAISIRLVLKVEPGEQWAAAREVRKRLKRAFDEEGIEIPFPQRTVWMHDPSTSPRPASRNEPDFGSDGEPSES
jgi:small-conductance mechanosensitive channel